MEYQITKSYLVFPTSRNASVKRIIFRKNGECVFDIDLALDYVTPERDVYVDMKRFSGDVLDVSVCPGMKLEIKQKDSMPNCRFRERLRPKYHFTSPEGYADALCGLVYQNGLYHMFYRLNPVGTKSGNMHWGHAVSTNLLDWDCRSTALFPDKSGTMLPGSVIIDAKDKLGVKSDSARSGMVLFYTAAGGCSEASKGQPFTQCMAVSTDGGMTFMKMPSNPLIPHFVGENRHPKVVYSEALGIYVMSLYLEGDKCLILTSENLLEWEKRQEISFPGENDCPAFLPFKYGDSEKWVLLGASDRYIIGEFDGKKFTPDHEGAYRLCCSDGGIFAAQHLENISGGIVRIAPVNTDFSPFGMPFNGAMTVPQRLDLVDTPDGIRLKAYPCAAEDKLRGRKTKERRECTDFSDELSDVARDIVLSINPKDATFAKISLFGSTFVIDFPNMTFTDGVNIAPITRNDGRVDVRILSDTCGMEIYLSGGLAYMVRNTVPDMNLSTFVFSSDSVVDLKYEAYKMRDSRKSDKRR